MTHPVHICRRHWYHGAVHALADPDSDISSSSQRPLVGPEDVIAKKPLDSIDSI